ncbi:MAG: peptidylprolyl isomerase [Saccharofermentanales bacterium]|jgi:peptidyl-prolyl cis-trans isomerase B (cyclophilin B)
MKNKIAWYARIGLIVLVIVSLFVLAACEEKEVDAPSVSLIETVDSEPKTEGSMTQMTFLPAQGFAKADEKTNFVQIVMDSGNAIVIELKPDQAPITVANFQKLVGEEFYDGLIFHRVIQGFMIQGGDPEGTGMGGSKESIKGEFSANGVDNTLPHKRGVISMARTRDPNSASSQFFICDADSPHLDGSYAAFGSVVFGLDEVDRIAALKVDMNDRPLNPPAMVSVFFVTPLSD